MHRTQNLIDGILQYSRVGCTEQGAAPVDLSQIVPEIIDTLGAPEHISIQIESNLPTVDADATRITQVFQNLLRIFKLFQTLAPRDGSESTGAGLTITKKIVEMYGGQLWVESEVGQGSTFFFTFPKSTERVVDEALRGKGEG